MRRVELRIRHRLPFSPALSPLRALATFEEEDLQ